MPQLDPTWFASQLFWLVVCFSILYIVLSRCILPPLQGVIASRKGAIDGDLVAAQKFKEDAEAARLDYEKTLLQSREAAQKLLADAEINSKEKAQSASKALEAQVATQLANASKNITVKKQELLSALMPEIAGFSSMITEKLTSRTPSVVQVETAIKNI